MNRQEAEQALRAWASIERDELVRAAHQAGVSKNRIYTITGIARTTIDRILESSMLQSQKDHLIHYLERFASNWPRPASPMYFLHQPVASARSAQDVADALLADAEFQALRLGTFLGSPDGQYLASAVEALTPPPYRQDIVLLVDALQIAAKTQQDTARQNVLKGVAGIVGGAVLGVLVRGLAAPNS